MTRRRETVQSQVKICRLCSQKTESLSYRDYEMLRRFTSERGKLLATRITKNCAKHQRMVANAVKQARHLALLAFTSR
ncbi:30S ribosomal protein S18, partial [bacterium]|nr:30S ribosomal protein S18 [bacterium]